MYYTWLVYKLSNYKEKFFFPINELANNRSKIYAQKSQTLVYSVHDEQHINNHKYTRFPKFSNFPFTSNK